MTKKQAIQLFEERKVRTVWDDKEEKWYFCVADVLEALTDSVNPTDYIKKMKKRDPELAKGWGQIVTPLSDQAIADYKRLGYSDAWINQRIKSIEVRKELTDEWKRTGVQEGLEFASLTDIITREWSGFTTKQYKHYKGLKKENLRDNMTNLEIALNILAEASATEISKERDPKGFNAQTQVAREGGSVAKAARKQLESKLGRSVISKDKASDYLLPEKDESQQEDK